MFNNGSTGILSILSSGGIDQLLLGGNKIAFVSKSGNDSTGVPGRLDKTYLTIQAGLNAVGTDGITIVYPGVYAENLVVTSRGSLYLYKGSFIQPVSGNSITINSGDNMLIGGEGAIVIPSSGNGVVVTNGNLNMTAYSITSTQFNGSQNSNTQYAIYNQNGNGIYNISNINSGQGCRVSGGIVIMNTNTIKGADQIIRMDGGNCMLTTNKGLLANKCFVLNGGRLRVMGGYFQLDDSGLPVQFNSRTAECLISNSQFVVMSSPNLFAYNADTPGNATLKIYGSVISNVNTLQDVVYDVGSVVVDPTIYPV